MLALEAKLAALLIPGAPRRLDRLSWVTMFSAGPPFPATPPRRRG
jgi:hypothetical protein